MTARPAYISSFATTGILVASSVLMLVLFGTFVAFHRWPQTTGGGAVNRVAIPATAPRAAIFPAAGPAIAPPRRASHAHAFAAPVRGLLKVVSPQSPGTFPVAGGPATVDPAIPAESPAAPAPALAQPASPIAGGPPAPQGSRTAPVGPVGSPGPGAPNPVSAIITPAEQVIAVVSPGAAAEVGTLTQPVANLAGDLTGANGASPLGSTHLPSVDLGG